jgi:phosphoribosylanthranilate isomerase
MPVPAIKICGVRTSDALKAAIGARADYIGFNFYPPSPRCAALTEAAALGAQASGQIQRVGVFVDADDARIAEVLATGALDALQLHGSESPARAAELRARHGLPVWKVLAVANREDIACAALYTGAADLILFDAKTPKDALPGGMGLVFDWALLAGVKHALPWGLAGGLSPVNVAEAARVTGAPLVDAASGVESAHGIKDPELITAFCKAARGG